MNRKEMRRAWIDLCARQEPDMMLTLATNQPWDIPRMHSLVRSFAARMDAWGLGSTWFKQAPSNRFNGVFFIEHVGTNIHAHGLVHFPYGNPIGVRLASEGHWAKLCPSGSVDVAPIDWIYGCATYCTKEMQSWSYNDDQIVLLAKFMSPTSLSKRPTKPR
jgi:hypothetical protein